MFHSDLPQTIDCSSRQELEAMLTEFEQGNLPANIIEGFKVCELYVDLAVQYQELTGAIEVETVPKGLESKQRQDNSAFIISVQIRPWKEEDEDKFAIVSSLPCADEDEFNRVIHIEIPFPHRVEKENWAFLQRLYSLKAKENFPYKGLHFGYLLPFKESSEVLAGLNCDVFYMYPFFSGDLCYFNSVKRIGTIEVDNRKMLLNILQCPKSLPFEDILLRDNEVAEPPPKMKYKEYFMYLRRNQGSRLIAQLYIQNFPHVDYLHRLYQRRQKDICWRDLDFHHLIVNGLAENGENVFSSFLMKDLYDPRLLILIVQFWEFPLGY